MRKLDSSEGKAVIICTTKEQIAMVTAQFAAEKREMITIPDTNPIGLGETVKGVINSLRAVKLVDKEDNTKQGLFLYDFTFKRGDKTFKASALADQDNKAEYLGGSILVTGIKHYSKADVIVNQVQELMKVEAAVTA